VVEPASRAERNDEPTDELEVFKPRRVLSLSNEKPHQYWFYFYGFNFAIFAGLFVGFFGWLLGRWRGMLAAFRAKLPMAIWPGHCLVRRPGGGQRRGGAGSDHG
jgi:hypothetical protein